MPKTGLGVNAQVTLRDKDGNLIVKRYAKHRSAGGLIGRLIREYHSDRIKYSQAMRGEVINPDYRTGGNVPATKKRLIRQIFILKYRRTRQWLTHLH